MSAALTLLSAYAVAVLARGLLGTAVPLASPQVLAYVMLVTLGATLGSALGAYLAARRTGLPLKAAIFQIMILRNFALAVATGWGVALLFAWLQTSGASFVVQAQFAAVTLLAGGVACGELLSRYHDRPGGLLATDPSLVYICVNIGAGTVALVLVKRLGVFDTTPHHRLIYETMLAGFGAIAFFRSSLFTVRVGGTDLGVGPSTLLKALLDASDMMLNRWQAMTRGDVVRGIMQDVVFAKAKTALPTTCFTLMTEFPASVQTEVGEQIRKLDLDKSIELPAKTIILGIYMIQQVGAEVLDRAVRCLGDSIKGSDHSVESPGDSIRG